MQHIDAENLQVIVIGGGPSGLASGHELAASGARVIVLEKSNLVGGIARTESYRGYHFDMGGHRFFSKSTAVNEFWLAVLADQFLSRSRLSRIYFRNRFFSYPLKPLDAFLNLGIWESCSILCSYLWWKIFPYKEETTFEQWVTNRFGRRLFKTFFESYTEKVWGIPCSELSSEWAAQRIKGLSLKTAVVNMLKPNGRIIKTLIESFQYPALGPGMMWREVASRIQSFGGEVRMNSDVVRIERAGHHIDRIVVNDDGEESISEGTHFVSSMPLTELVEKMVPAPPDHILAAAQSLSYRDFLTVCLIVDKPHLFDDNWIYIHDPSVQVGRIQNYKNWSDRMVPDRTKSSLGLEYFCTEGDALWNMDDTALIELGKREVAQLGLTGLDDVMDGCVFRVEKSYPIYESSYREHLTALKDFVNQFDNLQTIGRNGLHRYNNQDHAMLTGLYAAHNILHGESHDLWSVNEDRSYHEELRGTDSINSPEVLFNLREPEPCDKSPHNSEMVP